MNKSRSFWIEGAFGQQPWALERLCVARPFPPAIQFGVVQSHRGFCFTVNYPSGSAVSLSFISAIRLSARQFQQNLIWSVLTLLRCWQRSGISSALGQVVSKHTLAQMGPLLPFHSLMLQIRESKSIWKRPCKSFNPAYPFHRRVN